MYNAKLAVALKHSGKVLREFGDKVYVPFGAEYSILIKNMNSVRAEVTVHIDDTDVGGGTQFVIGPNESVELERFIKNGNLESFSEQQLVSCDNRKNHGKDMGCNGGLMDNAFSWIEYNNGLCAEEDYEYTSGDTKSAGDCMTTCENVVGSKVQSFVDVPPSSDADMMDALAKQPVSIAIEADQKDFQLYTSGVFTGSCGTNLDHGVLTVGYGTMDGVDYYRVKNSWGTTWGDEGYIYLGRGSEFNNGAGQCGMLMQASYPVV